MASFRLRDLRGRLFLVVLLALLPVVALLLSNAAEMRRWQRDAAEEALRAHVHQVVAGEAERLRAARALLATLGEVPLDPEACRGRLAAALDGPSALTSIAVLATDGATICAAGPPIAGAAAGGEASPLSDERSATAVYEIDASTGRTSIVLSHFVAARGETPATLLVGALPFEGVDARSHEQIAGSATVTVLDVNGRVLARHPDPQRWIGRRARDAPLVQSIRAGGTGGITRGLDGVRRVYAYERLTASAGRGGEPAYLAVGVPTSEVFRASRTLLIRNLFSLVLVLVAAGVAVGLGGRFLVLRRVDTLVESMRRFASGDRLARAPDLSGDEIGELARAFNKLAADLAVAHDDLERRVEERTGELILALQEIDERRAMLEALLDSLPVGVFVARRDGSALLVNRAAERILEALPDASQPAGPNAVGFGVEGEDGTPYPQKENPLTISLEQGRPATRDDLWVRRRNGDRVAIRASSAPVHGSDGTVRFGIVVFEDRTRERELDRAKDEFVGLASHQLRTPASGVKAYLSMLLDGDAGPLTPAQAEFAARAYESNEHGLHLIEDLLAVTKIESGRYVVARAPTDLGALAERVVEEQRPWIERRGQRIDLSLPAEPVVASVDEAKIRMAVANLVDNASKYTSRGGRVVVEVAPSDGHVALTVRDTGVGISPTDRARLFQRFSRIERRESDSMSGTGLGLYLVRRIVELHGGAIELDSEPGVGSAFTLRLRRE